ncbi:hypothetical protein N0V87_002610 [Didymella glomerata]|uniref:Uncharacterized protein n=1 Tax=Didymella glomerata TaxID=749621 RepID=A0A9W9C1M5_9PLEO|nr:hypothetical protein N0V87_002610 [Didymella glomerata]
MGLFLPFVLALAVFWLVIGVYLAKFLAQKYKGKPWNSKNIDSHDRTSHANKFSQIIPLNTMQSTCYV